MKLKLITALFALMLLLSLSACNIPAESEPGTVVSSEMSETTEPKTEEPTSPEENPDSDVPTEGLLYSVVDGYAEVSLGDAPRDLEKIVIADTYEGLPVTHIATSAFEAMRKLKTVVIPDSVSAIGDYAFESCISLTEVTLPNRMKNIGSGAFRKCIALKKVTLPDALTRIFGETFADCSALEQLVIPDAVISINARAFERCQKLIQSEIGVSYVDKWVIYADRTLTEAILREDTVGIAMYAFEDCKDLQRVELPDTLKTLGYGAFSGCKNLNAISLPDNIKNWESLVFSGCTNLSSVILPNHLEEIPMSSFTGCANLETIVIPNNVKKINNSAFSHCSALRAINIPDGLKSIGQWAFENCNLLMQTEDDVSYVGKWVIDCDISAVNVDLRDDTVGIAVAAFEKCSALRSIDMPKSLRIVGYGAFKGCDEELFHIENGVSYVGRWAISIDRSITEVTLRPGTIGLADMAFGGGRNLQHVALSDGIVTIGSRVFDFCDVLEYVVLPISVIEIEDEAFYSCDMLTAVYYLGTAEDWAFVSTNFERNGLAEATVYFYSEELPTVSGNYWHYVDGVPTAW